MTKPLGKEGKYKDKEPTLKGTFASVLLLALFIVVTWLGVFVLFIARG
ncbi:cytochrome c oxidase subunit 2A [Paenibacillus daejeonensis]|nr:cytochrome c oxidase subunit 2A [Paenibacillus daejeonensis]